MTKRIETKFKLKSKYDNVEHECFLEYSTKLLKKKDVITRVQVYALCKDSPTDNGMWEPYATLNVGNGLPDGTFLFKNESENEGFLEQMIEEGIVVGVTSFFGDMYPRVKLVV